MSPENPDNDDPTGLAKRANAVQAYWAAQDAAKAKAKQEAAEAQAGAAGAIAGAGISGVAAGVKPQNPTPARPIQVDDFQVGLPPVPPTGGPVPAQAVNNVQPGQVVSPTLMQAASHIEVTDQYGQRLISDGSTYQMTEVVVQMFATPDVPTGPSATGSAYLDKNGMAGDIHRLTPKIAGRQFSDDLNYVARQTVIVIDTRTEERYTVGYFIIQTTRSGTTITNCNRGCKP